MNASQTRVLAGIVVPDTPIVTRAVEYAREHCEPYLFNHQMRSWLFAAALAQVKHSSHDPEVLAVATLLHDIGLAKAFSGPLRFEVEGANAARAFARTQGMMENRAQLVWDGVALNSTPSIGLYKESEVALCTVGIGLDWGGWGIELLTETQVATIVDASAVADEAAVHARRLPHRRIAPRHHLRQFRAGFRRAVRAWLHETVDGGYAAQLAVQGLTPASHSATLRT